VANAVRSNKILIDSTGAVATSRTKVVYALFTPSAAGDTVTLRETLTDADIFTLKADVAGSRLFRFEETNLVFTNGIYVESISTGAKLLLVTVPGN
jgi:hypothetical protein